jgi:DNA (cytosine-5)-methyltransferase 1
MAASPDIRSIGLRPAQGLAEFSVVSLFSGIGGFDLGFQRAGVEVRFQCEISQFCLRILERHWPSVPRSTNIKELNGSDIPLADAWVAGFPCQDVSLARMGKRDGLRGHQSSLFFEFARLVDECRPRLLLVENVPGLLSSHQGRDFGTVLGTLAELGYGLGWRVLNSKNFGVPQSRQRVFIVGSHRDSRGPAKVLFESERGEGDVATGGPHGSPALSPFKRVVEHPGRQGAVTPTIAYCLYAESARHTGTDWSRNYDSLRYHALGNAVTPPVAQWLAERIKAFLALQRSEESEQRLVAGRSVA